MKRIIIVVMGLFLFGCALPPKYSSITMMEPIQTAENSYEDDKIRISFAMTPEVGTYGSGFGTKQTMVYRGISFLLTNKTDKKIIIDWNQISVIKNNMAGHAVMHEGIKFNECNNPKAPSYVPPKLTFSDIIIPCYGVKWVDLGRYGARWDVSMLPPTQLTQQVDFGVFLPLQFDGGETADYKFMFRALGPQPK